MNRAAGDTVFCRFHVSTVIASHSDALQACQGASGWTVAAIESSLLRGIEASAKSGAVVREGASPPAGGSLRSPPV